MVIVDTALAKRAAEGNPVRVGIIGAGYIARGMAYTISRAVPGMEVVAVSNRTVSRAVEVFEVAGHPDVRFVHNIRETEDAISSGKHAVTDDPHLLCKAGGIDVIVDLTGEVEFGAEVTLDAIRNGKHIIASAEVDSLLGPILKYHADRAGVVYTGCDGDQPGVIMNLLRWVRSIGFNPVLAGNIKGILDPYRTPETQAEFAKKNGQTPRMATHFADGTKLAMEMAVVANATGFHAGRRGMYGPVCKHVDEAVNLFPSDGMLAGGLVDYILGSEPGPGVFVLGYNDGSVSRTYADYFKRGPGPFHVFYIPYHFPHAELPLTAARAALFHDATVTPLGAPAAEVVTVAKKDMQAGQVLDGFGGFATYGLLDNYRTARQADLLPMGLSEGCRLNKDVAKDQLLTFDDVNIPKSRLCDQLYSEQLQRFEGAVCPVGRWNVV